jgi:hypothetical protein
MMMEEVERGMTMIRVRVLQVNTDPQNTSELAEAVATGHTDGDGWQMPMDSAPGDLAVWYAAGRQQYIAWGWVESAPMRVTRGFGPFRGQVAGMQAMEPVDRKKVMKESGVNGGLQSYQTVKDEITVKFLQSLGLLPRA